MTSKWHSKVTNERERLVLHNLKASLENNCWAASQVTGIHWMVKMDALAGVIGAGQKLLDEHNCEV